MSRRHGVRHGIHGVDYIAARAALAYSWSSDQFVIGRMPKVRH